MDLDGDGIDQILFLMDAGRQLGPLVFGYSESSDRFVDRTDEFFDLTEFYKAFYDGFYSQDVARLVDSDGDGRMDIQRQLTWPVRDNYLDRLI